MKKKALIFGISGQDGSYLTQHLIKKGYLVFGTTRSKAKENFINHKRLKILGKCKIYTLRKPSNSNVSNIIKKIKPDEIYNFAGESSVANSFSKPLSTFEDIFYINLFIIESIKNNFKKIKYFNACSSECFGNKKPVLKNDKYIFDPLSPYAVAKSASFYATKFYREEFKLNLISGIMYNHESSLRKKHFLTKKIVSGLVDIKYGRKKILKVGNIEVARDWGYAPEYVIAMHLLLQQKKFDDYIIATGKKYTVRELITRIAKTVGINIAWNGRGLKEYAYNIKTKDKIIQVSKKLYRPIEVKSNKGDISKIVNKIGWKPKINLDKMLEILVMEEIKERNA